MLLTGSEPPFFKANPSQALENLLHTQNFSLGLNIMQRHDDEFPLDATVTTFLRGDQEKQKDDGTVELLRKWADGKARPHDGSYFVMKNKGKRVFPEYV